MTEYSSHQRQECTFAQILCFILERCIHTLQSWKWKEQREYFECTNEYNSIIWNRRRVIWVRVDCCPRGDNSGIAPRDSDGNDNTRNQTNRIRRSDHLHVDEQWHRLVTRWSKFRRMFFELSEGQRLRKRFRQGHWTFLDLGDEGKWYGMHVSKPEGKWNSIVFPNIKCVESGILEKWRKGATFFDSPPRWHVKCRVIVSHNQVRQSA